MSYCKQQSAMNFPLVSKGNSCITINQQDSLYAVEAIADYYIYPLKISKTELSPTDTIKITTAVYWHNLPTHNCSIPLKLLGKY